MWRQLHQRNDGVWLDVGRRVMANLTQGENGHGGMSRELALILNLLFCTRCLCFDFSVKDSHDL